MSQTARVIHNYLPYSALIVNNTLVVLKVSKSYHAVPSKVLDFLKSHCCAVLGMQTLEARCGALGVTNYSVAQPTLEQIFLQFALEEDN